MHDDSDVIQASTPGNIRLPRLWANSKEMKTDTYSDRFSTTCRNDSTMSSNRTSNKNGNPLQREGNSCLKSSVSGRQQNGVSHRGTTSHSRAYVHHTTVPQSGDQSGDSTRKWRDSYSKTCLSQFFTSISVTTPDHASQQPTLDSATRSCTKRRRHQVQPRRRRESWPTYVMHLAGTPRRSSNQTRNQRHRRLFFYLNRASYGPPAPGHTFYFSARPAPSPLSNGPVFLFSRLLLLTTSPFTKIPR